MPFEFGWADKWHFVFKSCVCVCVWVSESKLRNSKLKNYNLQFVSIYISNYKSIMHVESTIDAVSNSKSNIYSTNKLSLLLSIFFALVCTAIVIENLKLKNQHNHLWIHNDSTEIIFKWIKIFLNNLYFVCCFNFFYKAKYHAQFCSHSFIESLQFALLFSKLGK